jgi:hypothetical protein
LNISHNSLDAICLLGQEREDNGFNTSAFRLRFQGGTISAGAELGEEDRGRFVRGKAIPHPPLSEHFTAGEELLAGLGQTLKGLSNCLEQAS